MEVFVCRGYSGSIYRINADENLPLSMLIPVMAQSIGLYSSDVERLGIYNLTKDREYTDADTLEAVGAQDGDLLILADGGICHKK